MKIFRDRVDAGQQLAEQLAQWKDHPHTVVIGLPRGGVPVANEVAKALHLPLDIVCPRKIGAPYNKEFAIGAITETGEGMFSQDIIASLGISEDYLLAEVKAQKLEALKRIAKFRQGRAAKAIKEKIVILIDDGIATGSTMKAAICSLRKADPQSIIVAVPVASADSLQEMRKLSEEVICLSVPLFFQAVGQFYSDFSQTEDDEVIKILSQQA